MPRFFSLPSQSPPPPKPAQPTSAADVTSRSGYSAPPVDRSIWHGIGFVLAIELLVVALIALWFSHEVMAGTLGLCAAGTAIILWFTPGATRE
jgi:hypothetical protein